MKEWKWVSLTVVAILFVGGYSGYKYVLSQAADKIYEELSSNEDIIKEMEKLSKDLEIHPSAQELPAGSNDAPGSVASETKDQSSSNQKSKALEEKKNTVAKAAELKPQTQAAASSKEFKSRDDAVEFAMGRFSASEIYRFQKMASDGLTAEEKKELKAIAYSKFSAAEIEAVRQVISK